MDTFFPYLTVFRSSPPRGLSWRRFSWAGREPPPMADFDAEVIIIGSGAAGLTAALTLAPRLEVVVLAKSNISSGSTAWAQGGIAAVLEPGDTFESHIDDTMTAGDRKSTRLNSSP